MRRVAGDNVGVTPRAISYHSIRGFTIPNKNPQRI